MKKINLKSFTALLAVVLIAGVATIFYACKKEQTVKDIVAKAWQEKVEYMDIPCVDFSRIKKDANNAKGTTMLHFDSWEHYTSVIDAMLEFSYNYIATRIQQIENANPGISEDDLSLIMHNEGVYQFMPLYSFINTLQFDNSAFKTLRTKEIQWINEPQALNKENPFDEMEIGYIQSALHNENGDVMIGNEIFNPKDGSDAKCCPTNKRRDNKINGVWPTYNYDSKKREFRAELHSQQSYTYAKTSVYYFNAQNNRIIWCTNIGVWLSGYRYSDCTEGAAVAVTIDGGKSLRVSVIEKYCWYFTYPNYLLINPPGGPSVGSSHVAPGCFELPYELRNLTL